MDIAHSADAWKRFEAILTAMCPGDVITVDEAVYETEMAAESAHMVLEALCRADLFEQHGKHFLRVRCSTSLTLTKHQSA
jgi:hypothetical protein